MDEFIEEMQLKEDILELFVQEAHGIKQMEDETDEPTDNEDPEGG